MMQRVWQSTFRVALYGTLGVSGWAAGACTSPNIRTPNADAGNPEAGAPNDGAGASDGGLNGASCDGSASAANRSCRSGRSCNVDHGGCDPLVSCSQAKTSDKLMCGECPEGFSGDGAMTCVPMLADLKVSAGVLQPKFDPNTKDYTVATGMSVAQQAISAMAPEQVAIEVDGKVLESGATTQPYALDLFERQRVTLRLKAANAQSASYTVESARIPTSEQALSASNPGESDRFGAAIAFDGDTLVVGATGQASSIGGVNPQQFDEQAPASGAVYVFTRVGDAWQQQAMLKAPHPDTFDGFGFAVALEGDLLAVGAGSESSADPRINGDQLNNDASLAGAVYVFRRTAGQWAQEAYLKAANAEAGDEFGWSVAVSNGVVAVGAVRESSGIGTYGASTAPSDNSAASSGAVYLFERIALEWKQTDYIKAVQPTSGARFGSALALAGDLLVVGAPWDASNAQGIGSTAGGSGADKSGAVHVYRRAGGVWNLEAYIKASDAAAGDEFGDSLALRDDLLVVGAALNDLTTPDSVVLDVGAAYVLSKSSGTWREVQKLGAEAPNEGDEFGTSVSICGAGAIVVGATGEDSGGQGVVADTADETHSEAGAAFAFGYAGTWHQTAYLKAEQPAVNDRYGNALVCNEGVVAVGVSDRDGPLNTRFDQGAVCLLR